MGQTKLSAGAAEINHRPLSHYSASISPPSTEDPRLRAHCDDNSENSARTFPLAQGERSPGSTVWEVDIDRAEKPSEQWASGFYIGTVVLAFLGFICSVAWCFLPSRTEARSEQWGFAETQYSGRG